MTINNGGPAFPTVAGQTVYSNGMSLRDWFAGQALAGLCAHPESDNWEYLGIAASAYTQADAMIAARNA